MSKKNLSESGRDDHRDRWKYESGHEKRQRKRVCHGNGYESTKKRMTNENESECDGRRKKKPMKRRKKGRRRKKVVRTKTTVKGRQSTHRGY
jgi:hypothetical protein